MLYVPNSMHFSILFFSLLPFEKEVSFENWDSTLLIMIASVFVGYQGTEITLGYENKYDDKEHTAFHGLFLLHNISKVLYILN